MVIQKILQFSENVCEEVLKDKEQLNNIECVMDIEEGKCTLRQGDCLELMKDIPNASIDMILCDLPYGITKNLWDTIIPFKPLWEQYNRIIKKDGVVVLTSKQPFTSKLICSNLELVDEKIITLKFRYDTIWEKTIGSGQLNIKRRPLTVHEEVLIFSKSGTHTYNKQMSEGKPYKINRNMKKYDERNYNSQKEHTAINEGKREPRSVIKIPNPRIEGGHPTQKPGELLKYLIRTYSNEGEVVLDNCMGSGSTGISSLLLGRAFIGIEQDKQLFEFASKNIFFE